jgi:hypothetical protein
MLAVLHRLNNQLIHQTPAGLASLIDLEHDELTFDDGPSSVWLDQAQTSAHVSFSLLVQLSIDSYRPERRDDFESAVDARLCAR